MAQVEVKIDYSRESSNENILSNFSVEADVFDTGRSYDSDENIDLLSCNVAHLKLNPPSKASLGFHGYVLVGKLERPKLWSAERVRNHNLLTLIYIYI